MVLGSRQDTVYREISNRATRIIRYWLASLAAKQHFTSSAAITFLVTIASLIKTLPAAIRLIVKPTQYSIITLI